MNELIRYMKVAFKWFKLSAEQNGYKAQHILGWHYQSNKETDN